MVVAWTTAGACGAANRVIHAPGTRDETLSYECALRRGERDDGIYMVIRIQSKTGRNKRFTQTHAPDKGEIRALKSNRAASREDQA